MNVLKNKQARDKKIQKKNIKSHLIIFILLYSESLKKSWLFFEDIQRQRAVL